MLEWIPVVFGCLLGMLHVRRAIHQRTLSLMVCVIAFATALLAGELREDPWLVIIDAGLVVAGLALTLSVHAQVLRRRELSARAAAHALSAAEHLWHH